VVDRLLILDDDDALGRICGAIGETVGYTVRVSTEAAGFWQAVEDWSPTVIILDLRMPGTDGVEILRGLSDRRVTARILLLSASDTVLLEAARRLGRDRGLAMAGALTKPVPPSRLREVLAGLKAASEPVTAGALQEGIERDELELVYQPKIEFDDGRLVGVEALVRWHPPTGGSILPGRFVAIAEASGIIDNLTELVIEKSLAQVAAWRAAGFDIPVSINVSPTNLRALDFPDRLIRTCDRHGVAPSSVSLELTETAAHDDHTTLMDILTRLGLRGLRLSIDDFGTGHSSLFKLHTLPFAELKLDRSFIVEARASSRALIIIKSTIDLAHALGMLVVAEGIEDGETAALLHDIGCDVGQGFHFSKPMPGDAVTRYIQRRAPRAPSSDAVAEVANP
jgi:EAL domain-containing protein (putative c-di-GMP-specific phosphodiesterase class I)/CheY-like chemotaxis protein